MTHNPSSQFFPHERLAAYGYARSAVQLVAARRGQLRGLPGNVAPQLERAVIGAHTNLCAGAAAEGAEARRYFRIALSEAAEAGGCIDAALDFGALSAGEHGAIREALLRLRACLHGLAHGAR